MSGTVQPSFQQGQKLTADHLNAIVRDIVAARSFKASGASAVDRPEQDKLRETVSAADHGAVGDGLTDDAPGINAAIIEALGSGARVRRVRLPGRRYRLASPILVPSGGGGAEPVVLEGDGADATVLDAAAAMAAMVLGADGTNRPLVLRGATLRGNGLAQNGVQVAGGAGGTRIEGNRIIGVVQDAVLLRGGSDFFVTDNVIETAGRHGVVLTLACARFLIARNIVRDPAGAGIIFSQAVKGVVAANYVHKGGPGGDGITGYHDGNTDLAVVGNVIDAADNHGIHVGGARLAVTGNTVNGTALGDCILVSANVGGSDANAEAASADVVVVGNACTGAARFGVLLLNVTGGAVAGNSVSNTTQSGVVLAKCSGVAADGNAVRASAAHGVVLRGTTACHLSGNLVLDPTGNGFRMERVSGGAESTGNTVSGNRVVGGATSFIEVDASGGNTYAGNFADGYSSQPFSRATPDSVWRHGSPDQTTLASAAALPLPSWGDLFIVTGTTTITSVSGGSWTGRRITLLFKGAATVGGNINNLRLNGGTNFVAASGNTLALVYDGTNWVEAGRGTAAS